MNKMNKIISNKTQWIIMSKDREHIAKGVTRDRCIVPVNEVNNKRLLTYSSKGRAESAFSNGNGFSNTSLLNGYSRGNYLSDYLEAVEVNIKVEIV